MLRYAVRDRACFDRSDIDYTDITRQNSLMINDSQTTRNSSFLFLIFRQYTTRGNIQKDGVHDGHNGETDAELDSQNTE